MRWTEGTQTFHLILEDVVCFVFLDFLGDWKFEVFYKGELQVSETDDTPRRAQIACERWIRNNINKDKKFLRPTEVLR